MPNTKVDMRSVRQAISEAGESLVIADICKWEALL